MVNGYSYDEINEILLKKNLSEFYFAIVEYQDNYFNHYVFNIKEEIISDLGNISMFDNNRVIAILTSIDDFVFDIGGFRFVDLDSCMIVCYDNVLHFYDEWNARVRVFSPFEEELLCCDTALLELDNEEFLWNYEVRHIHDEVDISLNEAFCQEVFQKKYSNRN